jgi:hypothetical protein
MNNNSASFLQYEEFSFSTALVNTSTVKMIFEPVPLLFMGKTKLTQNNSLKIVPIFDLNSPKYKLSKPFVVFLSREDDEYKIEYSPLELCAFDSDLDEAIAEFKEDMRDLCEKIMPLNDNELGAYPMAWKKMLKEFISINE